MPLTASIEASDIFIRASTHSISLGVIGMPNSAYFSLSDSKSHFFSATVTPNQNGPTQTRTKRQILRPSIAALDAARCYAY